MARATDVLLDDCPRSPNCVSSLARDDAHRVEAFAVRGPAVDAWQAARRTVEALALTRIADERAGYLRAEVRSRLGFVDDLELALAADGRRIDVRSAARIGWWDLGVNRRRVESLRARLRGAGVAE